MDFDICNFLSLANWKIFTVVHSNCEIRENCIAQNFSFARSIFTGIHTNTTSISIEVEDGGVGEP